MILSKDIIKEWSLESLAEQKREETANRIGRILYQAILVRTLDILSVEEQNELDEIMNKDSSNPKEVLLFLKKKIPTFDQLVKEEKENLKNDLLL